MDGFSYVDIFDTKGIEYLIIIGFLVLIIPFWIVLSRKKPSGVKVGASSGALTGRILDIPFGIFFGRNHSWAFLGKSGLARTGPDDFLLHLTGLVTVNYLKKPGEKIIKDEPMAEIMQQGKNIRILSPISGIISETNTALDKAGISAGNIYEKAWLYTIKPSDWIRETSACFLAENAGDWFRSEIERFRDLMADYFSKSAPGNATLILQDGGELRDHVLAELPAGAWQVFEKSFLTSASGT